jgi:hypothetical protein
MAANLSRAEMSKAMQAKADKKPFSHHERPARADRNVA